MKKKERDFNTDEFKKWLSSLHEEKPGIKFSVKSDEHKEIYSYLNNNLFGQIIVWNNYLVEEIITDQATNKKVFYLHYKMEDYKQITNLIKSFKLRMFLFCQKDAVIKTDNQERRILLCCTSALTTTLFAKMLQEFSDNNNLPYHFLATSIYDSETLSKDFDLILMAPQVQHYTKEMVKKYHQRFLIMNTLDFAQYDCNNIISQIQEVFLP